MALKLTVILLVLLFAVLKFSGRDVDGGPFAEAPGADPAEVLLAVAPLETSPKPPPLTNVFESPSPPPASTESATNQSADPAAQIDGTAALGQSALDLVILDPAAARDSLTLAPGAATPHTGIDSLIAGGPAPETTSNPEVARSMAEVTGSSVNLRAGPSTGNAVLGRAQGGDLVEWVSDPAPGWALIRHPDIEGDLYMSSQFLRRIAN